MKCKTIKTEDFTNYKKPSLFIGVGYCDYKCCIEANIPISTCQNCQLAHMTDIEIPNTKIIELYLSNIITESVVIGGLEPMLQFEDVLQFVKDFREQSQDDIVIYTGYYEHELTDDLTELKKYKNIIIKFGRFIPNERAREDKVLGVKLISDNQYAIKIS